MSKDNTIKQCVLICESFNSDFESASAFIKVGVAPIIEMCVGWLCNNGIKEIFMFFSKSKSEVEEYYNNYESNSRQDTKIHLNYVKPQQMKSLGDVMREVQFRNIISQDFIVLFADTISNLDLEKAIATHFKKKVQLKSVVLTSVVRDCSWDGKVHITSAETGEILQMDEDNGKDFVINHERINLKKMNVEFRRDFTHCDIYICTVDVFKSFKENYQYATMFDFINGMLTSQVYQEKILGHVLESHQQTFRVNKTKDYYLAYIHYISNHFYPYTLASRTPKPEQSKFVFKNFNKVLSNDVAIPRSTSVSNTCFIGSKCRVGSNVELQKCIISQNCHISDGAKLRNCIILEGCTIAEKSNFENCLIQKLNETQQIRRFKIFPKMEVQIVIQPLFEETPPPEQNTFEQDLQELLSEDPQIELVNELNSKRYIHNKSLKEFTKEMIRILSPQGPKGVQAFALDWGAILVKVHQNQSLLMDSLYYTCTNIPVYQKAFHVFLHYFSHFELLKDFTIISWYQAAIVRQPNSPTLQKCQNLIKVLGEQSEEQGNEPSEQAHKSSSSSSSNPDQKEDKD